MKLEKYNQEETKRTTAGIEKNNDLLDRTSFVLPDDWTDIEKMFLLWKVIRKDLCNCRCFYKGDEEDLLNNIESAILQALIILPIKNKRDIYPKLKILQYCTEYHLYNHEGKINYDDLCGLELEASAINEQLQRAIEATFTSTQNEHERNIERRNRQFENNIKNLTPEERNKLYDSLQSDSITLENLHTRDIALEHEQKAQAKE